MHAISYQTAKGEQKTVTLPDGSTIVMNTDTALSVQMSARFRTVILNRGEALFTVVHESARPFRVEAGGGVIQDIGTQFHVYKRQDKVLLSVLEGSVQIDTQPGAQG